MFHFNPPENIRKPSISRGNKCQVFCFQGDQKRALGRKCLMIKLTQTRLCKKLGQSQRERPN